MPGDQKTKADKSRRLWLQIAIGSLIAPCAISAQSAISVGQPVPLLDLVLIDGTAMLRNQLSGKVTIYLFWATWCPVCVQEMDHYQALHNKYKDRGIEVLALSLDQEENDVKKFLANKHFDLKIAMRTDTVRRAFGNIQGTPTVFVTDRNGTLRFKHLGAISREDLEQKVAQLL